MTKNELKATTQKSYYKKAFVITNDNGEHILQSYETQVAKIDANGKLHKLWNGYSRTTMQHINDFCKLFNVDFGGRKKDWDGLENENENGKQKYKIEFSNGFVNWTAGVVFDDEQDATDFGDKVCEQRNWRCWYSIVDA